MQTTSPSYLLLASLDAAQAHAHALQNTPPALQLEEIAAARTQLNALPGISLLQGSSEGPLRLVPLVFKIFNLHLQGLITPKSSPSV